MNIIIVDNYDEMSKVAADFITKEIIAKPNLKLGLATGSTPIGTYKEIIKIYRHNSKLSFKDVIVFNLDEYVGLSPENEQSYKYFMKDKLFNHIDIKEDNCYIPNGLALDLEEEARNYDSMLESHGYTNIQLLGIGDNGHIAFNEPNSHLNCRTNIVDLKKETIIANSRFFDSIDEVPKKAISMGLKGIMSAEKILLLASGKNKATAIKRMLDEVISTDNPSSILNLHKNVTIIIDKEAASLIK